MASGILDLSGKKTKETQENLELESTGKLGDIALCFDFSDNFVTSKMYFFSLLTHCIDS